MSRRRARKDLGRLSSGVVRLCLFGAPGDTANLGVSALLESVLAGVAERRPAADVTVFDNGLGARRASLAVGESTFGYGLLGARLSKRVHRPESLHQMKAAALVGGRVNPGTRAMARADAVLDISGGDSFTDLYGPKRWQSVEMPKSLALQLGRPLVLLPQTYGPYRAPEAQRKAEEIVRGSAAAWARDERSFAILQELAGPEFDPGRHRVGVDVAFGLPPRRPKGSLGTTIEGWLAGDRTAPVVGLNVSGLLFNDPGARAQFGLAGDYRATIDAAGRPPAEGERRPHRAAAARRRARGRRRVRHHRGQGRGRGGRRPRAGGAGPGAAVAGRDQVADLAARLVLRHPHARHDRRPVLGRAGLGHRLQRQGAGRVRDLRPGRRGGRRPHAARPRRRRGRVGLVRRPPSRRRRRWPPAAAAVRARAAAQMDAIVAACGGLPASTAAPAGA